MSTIKIVRGGAQHDSYLNSEGAVGLAAGTAAAWPAGSGLRREAHQSRDRFGRGEHHGLRGGEADALRGLQRTQEGALAGDGEVPVAGAEPGAEGEPFGGRLGRYGGAALVAVDLQQGGGAGLDHDRPAHVGDRGAVEEPVHLRSQCGREEADRRAALQMPAEVEALHLQARRLHPALAQRQGKAPPDAPGTGTGHERPSAVPQAGLQDLVHRTAAPVEPQVAARLLPVDLSHGAG